MTTIEFFHDAVCGWCYLLSPRLRNIAAKYPVKVAHRTFMLQRNRREMIERFGSLSQAKKEILQHWAQCQRYAEQPELINIERMQEAKFEYPSGYLAALYAKAIEQLRGQQGHWDFFDAVQRAHLYEAQNISDAQVLNQIAKAQGVSHLDLIATLYSPEVKQAIINDKFRAANFGIQTIPSLVINGKNVISQTLSQEQLEQLICTQIANQKEEEEI